MPLKDGCCWELNPLVVDVVGTLLKEADPVLKEDWAWEEFTGN